MNLTVTIICFCCGLTQILGSGYSAIALTRKEQREMVICIGWLVAPFYKCPKCRLNHK